MTGATGATGPANTTGSVRPPLSPPADPGLDRSTGVTVPAGFSATSVAAGIKSSGRPDLTLVTCDGPEHTAAGVFTRNAMCAAPVLWSRQVLTAHRLRAVVLNSGCANACTGSDGLADTHHTAERAADLLGCGAGEVAVCSTGLIGSRLPMPQLLAGLDKAVAGLDSGPTADLVAAEGVLTTDNVPKQVSLRHATPDGTIAYGGFAKGCGMIAPNMATMLSVLTTDAVVDAEVLQTTLAEVVDLTFNRLDVDGGTSTNDTVLLLASGASGVRPDPGVFAAGLTAVAADLVSQLQADAEGVTKHVTIDVRGAVDEADALIVARTVAQDNLCKTAFFAGDPNWGRIAMAVGRAPAAVEGDRVDIVLNDVVVCRAGAAAIDSDDDTESAIVVDLSGPQIRVAIDLHSGSGAATIRTTDLSHGYVEENSAYSS